MIETGLEPLSDRVCPDCGRSRFLRGPSGGLSVNVECAACGQRFNIALAPGGDLMLAQRIEYNGLWPDRGDWLW
jgi:uncharacterized protein (DUF983 family)